MSARVEVTAPNTVETTATSAGRTPDTACRTDSGKEGFLTRQDNVDRNDTDSDHLSVLDGLNLYETDEEDMRMVTSRAEKDEREPEAHADITTQDDKNDKTRDERKRLAGYKRSLRYLRSLDARDPTTLTAREKSLKRKHTYHARKYEALLNTTIVEVKPAHTNTTGNQDKPVISGKTVPQACSGQSTITSSANPEEAPSTSRGVKSGSKRGEDQRGQVRPLFKCSKELMAQSSSKGRALASESKEGSNVKRQRSGDTQVSEGKRLKPSTSLTSAPELQVAIIDRSQPGGKLTDERWLLLEEKILRGLVDELGRSEDDSFTAFDGAKWSRGVKIIGCGNEKALNFLKRCIQGIGELWPGAKLEIVSLDEVPFQTTVRVWVPPPILEDESILTLIKRQNKGLRTENWTIERGHARDKGEGKDLWIKIDSESLNLLRPLKGLIKYGLNQLRLMLPQENRDGNPERHKGGAD